MVAGMRRLTPQVKTARPSAMSSMLSIAGTHCALGCWLSLLVTPLVVTPLAAGFSGPAGPRLNYDAMPQIAPKPPPSIGRPSPQVPYLEPPQVGKTPSGQNGPALRIPVPSTPRPNKRAQPAPAPQAPVARMPKLAPGQQPADPRTPRGGVASPDTPEQRRQILTRLYGYLSSAKDAGQAARIAASIEQLWLHSGSPTTDILMRRADRTMETSRWSVAMTFVDAVVKLQPQYTEGWMRRALIFYQRNQPTRALRDLRRVLALEPNHYLALERIGHILESLGEAKPALEAFRKLLRLHPHAPGISKRVEELIRQVEGQPI